MSLSRRRFMGLAAACLAGQHLFYGSSALAAGTARYKAVAFDAFPIFDPRPIFARVKKLFPDKGQELSALWRSRQFEYTWLRTAGGQYRNFWDVTEDALIYAADSLSLNLSTDKRRQLMNAYLELKAYQDVKPTLQSLKDAGVRLAFLSNMTTEMLDAGIKNSGLDGMFEFLLSTDGVKTYKPDPRAYQMGVEAFGLKKQEIVFTAFAGWDAVGAKWYGYPTVWVNRLNFKAEKMDMQVDALGNDLDVLKRFIIAS